MGCFKINRIYFSTEIALNILKKGIPLVIQQSIPAISTMALTGLVSEYGVNALAGLGIIGKMDCNGS